MAMGAAVPRRLIGAAVVGLALVGMTLTASPASGGSTPLPEMQYPAQVEQGATFTVSGTGCAENGVGGQVVGGLEGSLGWDDVNVAADANGNWSVELTVPANATTGEYEWDVQCLNVLNSPFYPFNSIEIVPAGSLSTSTSTSSSSSSSSTAPASSTTPTTTAPVLLPRVTG
jgi:hypothetical protein